MVKRDKDASSTRAKKAEIACPSKLNAEERRYHRNLPFASDPFFEGEHRVAIASHLIDFALTLAELEPCRNDQIILDIGVGGGWTYEWFSRSGLNIVGTDISAHWLEIAKERYAYSPFVICDAEELPFHDECFDFINCYNALHHMPNQKKVIRECYRVLKQGGKVVFLEPGPTHAKSIQTRTAMKRFGTVEKGVNPFELKKSCLRAGFKLAYIKTDYTIYPDLRFHSHSHGKLLRGWLRDLIYSPFLVVGSLRGRAFVVAVK